MNEDKEKIEQRIEQINTRVGNNIAKARVATGMSGEELAKRIGVSQQQIFKYEKGGKNSVPPGRLVMIAEVLEVDLLSLFNNTFNGPNAQITYVRKNSCISAARNLIEIKDPNTQQTIHKIIKETLDNQK